METRRDSSDGYSVQRGRRKSTEFHTSGAKRCDSVLYHCNVLSWLFYSTRRSENKKAGIQCEVLAEFGKTCASRWTFFSPVCGFACTWMALRARNASPDVPLSNPRARATDLDGGTNLRIRSGRAHCMPWSREHEERPAAGREG